MNFAKIGAILAFVFGLYLVSVSIYDVVTAGNMSGWATNGISIAIGGGLVLYTWDKVKSVF